MNRRIQSIPASLSLSVTSRAKAMRAEGRDVCSFAAGEPDFDTPEHVKQAAAEALARGETKYAPVAGLPALCEAIADKLSRENGLSYRPSQVVVSNGAKHSVFNTILALCQEGDEVVIPAPYWLSYPEMVKVAGAEPVFVQCREQDDYKMRVQAFEAAVSPRTRAVVLNSPSNPVGCVYTRAELEALAEVAVRHGVYVISDEVYETMLYDGAEHHSIGSLSPEVQSLTITVNGFSKAFAMTGWRLGYLAGPEAVVKAVRALQSHSTSGPNTFAMYGALAALTGPRDCVARMVRAFAERRDLLHGRLSALEGVSCVRPRGAFYMLPNVAALGLDSVTFARRLLEEQGVAVVPGAAFGSDGNVRFSYACGAEEIARGMDRVAAFAASLRS